MGVWGDGWDRVECVWCMNLFVYVYMGVGGGCMNVFVCGRWGVL